MAAWVVAAIDDERQRFSLPSVIRSLHGESYALLLMSRPVEPQEVARQLQGIWQVRDECHARGRQSRSQERGAGTNWQRGESEGESFTAGASLILLNGSLSFTTQRQKSEGGQEHWSESLTQEEQDSVALELERLAERHAGRLLKALAAAEYAPNELRTGEVFRRHQFASRHDAAAAPTENPCA